MKIIAIDPSSETKNGVCIKIDGVITNVILLDPLQVIDLLNNEIPNIVIMEDSRLLGVYGKRSKRSIGVLDGICKLYENQCKKLKIKLIKIAPCYLDSIAVNNFPEAYKQYEKLATDCKVAILLHDCFKL